MLISNHSGYTARYGGEEPGIVWESRSKLKCLPWLYLWKPSAIAVDKEREVRKVGEILHVNTGGKSSHFKRRDCAGKEVPLKEDSFLPGPRDTKFIWLSSSMDHYGLQKTEEFIPYAIRQGVNTRFRFSSGSTGEIAQGQYDPKWRFTTSGYLKLLVITQYHKLF